jgi:hypothetical protein
MILSNSIKSKGNTLQHSRRRRVCGVAYHCTVKAVIKVQALALLQTGLLAMVSCGAFAQSTFNPLKSEAGHYLSRLEILSGQISDELHLSATPVLRSSAVRFIDSLSLHMPSVIMAERKNVDYLLVDNDEWSEDSIAISRKPLLKVLYRDKASLYQFRNDDFMVKVNPVFEFAVGTESTSDETLFINTRGIDVRGWIARKVGYYFYLTENQARYSLFVRERTDSFGAVPFAGYYKEYKTTGVDFFDARGYFDFTAAKFITIQFGHEKGFVGNGIRTTSISDFSEDYLFLKLRTQVWKINYQNLFMDLTADFLRGGDTVLPKKYAALHHLSINAAKWLNLGVWESVVFHRNNGFELQYLNPIIFYRSIEQLLGSPDNVMLGVDFRAIFLRHFSAYGQFMIDDFNIQVSSGEKGYWGNKTGWQLGLKYIDVFGLKNLDLQAEINRVRPYTFTHNDTIANYSNYNQPLAHPLGANFTEFFGLIRYQPMHPLTITAKVLFATQGRDTLGSNYGANIFIPTTEENVAGIYGNEVAQGVKNNLLNVAFTASYMLRHNLYVDGKVQYRKSTSDYTAFESSSGIFQLGVRMNLWRDDFMF